MADWYYTYEDVDDPSEATVVGYVRCGLGTAWNFAIGDASGPDSVDYFAGIQNNDIGFALTVPAGDGSTASTIQLTYQGSSSTVQTFYPVYSNIYRVGVECFGATGEPIKFSTLNAAFSAGSAPTNILDFTAHPQDPASPGLREGGVLSDAKKRARAAALSSEPINKKGRVTKVRSWRPDIVKIVSELPGRKMFHLKPTPSAQIKRRGPVQTFDLSEPYSACDAPSGMTPTAVTVSGTFHMTTTGTPGVDDLSAFIYVWTN